MARKENSEAQSGGGRGTWRRKDHICLEGVSGKVRSGILLQVIRSRCVPNSQGQGGRETSMSSGKEAGQLRSVQGSQNSLVWLKH